MLFFLFSLFLISQGLTAQQAYIKRINAFVPHEYASLSEFERQYLSSEKYQACLNWFEECSEMECKKIEYMSDHYKVVALLITPKNMEQKKYPLVIYNRGGSEDIGKVTILTIKEKIYEFIKNGYCVLAAQYRGVDGGQGSDEIGGADIKDVLSLFKVIDELDCIDRDNIFMYGHSRGGMMTYMAIKVGMPIKAAATEAGVADFFTFVKFRPEVEDAFLNKCIPNLPDKKNEEYEKRSAVCWADLLNVPLFITHAKDDTIVSIEESRNLIEKLKFYKKDYEYLEYDDGGHFLKMHRNEIQQKILAWFEKYRN
ncbi:S9 family peptidase [Candidatus Dependentiae bacterium]|nr:S9 family peptidase [Candidatus Dependentiae bacterium]